MGLMPKRASLCSKQGSASSVPKHKKRGTSKVIRKKQVRRLSAPYLLEGSSVRTITSSLTSVAREEHNLELHPQEFYKSILKSKGMDATEKSALSLKKGFFIVPTEDEMSAYGNDLIQALRRKDIETLRMEQKKGRSLQCCNNFGESLIHMACRRGFTDVVKYLLWEAGVSVRVCDDFGRTPLHDACWTTEPNFELMEILVRTDPELLLISDKRGHAPFHYVRRVHWESWIKFLDERRDLICAE